MTDPADGDASPGGTWLRRNAQHRVAGLTVGIMAVNPDPDDPAARLAVRAPDVPEPVQVVLRPGQPVEVLGRVLVAEQIDPGSRAAVLLVVREGEAAAPPGPDAGIGRVGLVLLVTSLVLALGVGWGGYAWRHSRPAPAMSAQAKQQGAVRLTYRFRHLPNPPTVTQVPGIGQVGLTLFDVAPHGRRVMARVSAPSGVGHDTQDVWLARGQSAVVGRLRLTVVDLYDRPDPSNDAADVVVVPAA